MFWNDFRFESLTVAYLAIGCVITLLSIWYGRKVLQGQKQLPRFVYIVLLFFIGYVLTVLSGSLKTLLIGWEIMGTSSFLLMTLHRNLSPGNSARAFFIYRMGDVGLLLAMWASHHLWREHTALLSALLLATASMQSSQLPFSSWLPQAMEHTGTTSAILLSTLTISMGVFLLLRTMPLWEHQLSIRILIALLGIMAAAMAAGFARVQSSVKRRLAYVSMAHTGLIFIEVAAGFKNLALIHIAANTAMTAYRLLFSPKHIPADLPGRALPGSKTWEDRLPKKLQYTLYLFYMKEWSLYSRLSRFLRPRHYSE